MNKNIGFALLLFALAIGTLTAATNYVQPGDVVTLSWATTSPQSGDAVIKGTSQSSGAIVGVALNGTGTANENISVAVSGVFYLPVMASSTIGNIAVGDNVYASLNGLEVCTTELSNSSSGVLFGRALEPITATTTPDVYETIKVLLVH